jgi:hypothetical protein
MDSRYVEHAKATAICVELALGGVQADIQKELDASAGEAAEALLRVLERLKERQKYVADLASGGVTVQQMIGRQAA